MKAFAQFGALALMTLKSWDGNHSGSCRVSVDQILGLPKHSPDGKKIVFERKLTGAEGLPALALPKLNEILSLFVNGPRVFVLSELILKNYQFQPTNGSHLQLGYYMYKFTPDKNESHAEIDYTNSYGKYGDTSFHTLQTITKSALGGYPLTAPF